MQIAHANKGRNPQKKSKRLQKGLLSIPFEETVGIEVFSEKKKMTKRSTAQLAVVLNAFVDNLIKNPGFDSF